MLILEPATSSLDFAAINDNTERELAFAQLDTRLTVAEIFGEARPEVTGRLRAIVEGVR